MEIDCTLRAAINFVERNKKKQEKTSAVKE